MHHTPILEHAAAAQGLRSYIIRGGLEGRERLRLVAGVLAPTTRTLLERAGVAEGMSCLDLGCGGGDVTLELARMVGPSGSVLGIDLDEVKLEIAGTEAAAARLANVEFRKGDALTAELPKAGFEIVYARFLLTHLRQPERAVERMRDLLVPGGALIVEDVDCSGHFIHPPSCAFSAFVEFYQRAGVARGGDPDIGPRLPAMLEAAGLGPVDMQVVQPAALRGEAKLISALTMEAIADAVLAAGFATRKQIDEIVAELYRLGRDETTVMSAARIVQAWGHKFG
jgi:SAM-dependent methyltransferase